MRWREWQRECEMEIVRETERERGQVRERRGRVHEWERERMVDGERQKEGGRE